MTQVDLLSFSMRTTPPKAGSEWFRIVEAKKKTEATKVYIYDEIGYWGTTAKDFAAILGDIDTDEIELHLNSPGGSVFDGLAIMAALKDHKARVVAKVDGMAASAASFILQAADERLITRNAQVMIHDAKAYAGGNAAQMRQAANLLDRVSNNIADIYAVRSGQGTVESWRALMTAGDEWYGGNEALAAGLVDAVVDNPEEDEDAPEEASNSWSAAEIEAFLNTSPDKLAANAGRLTVTNRVEEAPMSGTTPKSPAAPPEVPQPPTPVASTAPAPTEPVATPPAPEAGVSVVINGAVVTDLSAVQAHITGLETFKNETIQSGRKDFVASLAKAGKILANDEALSASEQFALSLSNEQFASWKAVMEAAPAAQMFQQHGVTPGDQNAPVNGGSNNAAVRMQELEEVIAAHRATGMSEERIAEKASFKELQQLKSAQTGS